MGRRCPPLYFYGGINVSREYTRDASEYGQQLIADAIRSLSGSSSGSSSTPSSEDITDLLKIHINVTQTEHQTISCVPFLVGCSINGVPTAALGYMQEGITQDSDIELCLLCSVSITPDEGYIAGELVLPEGMTAISSVDPNETSVSIGIPLGSSITLSATPATLSQGVQS